jgi:Ca-activated chloride channel family protein
MNAFNKRTLSRGAVSRLIASLLLACAPLVGAAQTGLNGGQSSGASPARGGAASQTRDARTDLVKVNVTVTDPYGRFVTGLEQSAFEVSEDGARQEVLYFDDGPPPYPPPKYSIFILFDTSNPVGGDAAINIGRDIADVIDMSSRTDVRLFNAGVDPGEIIKTIATRMGSTQEPAAKLVNLEAGMGLYEACAAVIQEAERAAASRKVVVLFTDKTDVATHGDPSALYELVRRSDVVFDTVGIVGGKGWLRARAPESHPIFTLNYLALISGGSTYFMTNPAEMSDVFTRIGLGTDTHYTIGYKPSRAIADGKLHRVKVHLVAPPRGFPSLRVINREEILRTAPPPPAVNQ